MSRLPTPRFLLLQARDSTDPVREHEVCCFSEALGVPRSAIGTHDLLAGPPDEAALDAVDYLLVGGSGDYSLAHPDPFALRFVDFLERVVVARGIPTFASCFGFHGLVAAGGGRVITDEPHKEVGTFRVQLTDAGGSDPIFAPLGRSFYAQLGHKDRADELPAGFVPLARSERSPYQAFRVDGLPVVATQFHPELTAEGMKVRYFAYLDAYKVEATEEEEDPFLASLKETPETARILPRWLDEVRAIR